MRMRIGAGCNLGAGPPGGSAPLTRDQSVTYNCGVTDDDDSVFRALADPTRRFLLDRLFERDGRALGELTVELEMTRFGVMKHLRVLEEAGLVVTRRSGREKLHYLNAVPIRLIHDRWIDKYTERWATTLTDLKRALEGTMEKVFEIYIKTTPERLWQAITDPELRKKYTFGVEVHSDWKPGSSYRATAGAGTVAPGTPISEGENLEVERPRRLVQSFRAVWSDDVKREGTSRVTWEIEPIGDSCRLTVTHDQLREGANAELYGGWPMILSGLKTLLETGEVLTTPGSLMYLAGSGHSDS
jgi:DNA-binding transcriptional ArsR family regulator/uncharacterized protein YndB with AHSA1/START domain